MISLKFDFEIFNTKSYEKGVLIHKMHGPKAHVLVLYVYTSCFALEVRKKKRKILDHKQFVWGVKSLWRYGKMCKDNVYFSYETEYNIHAKNNRSREQQSTLGNIAMLFDADLRGESKRWEAFSKN